MKKSLICVLLIGLIVCGTMLGCEKATQIRTAYISEITAAGSKNFGVKVCYAEDKRLEGKGTDVQIKFSKMGTIKIGKENEEKFEYEIQDYDEWYSLTHIFNEADENNEKGDKFEKYEDALNKTYLFNYNGDIRVTFRVVVGEIEQNSQENGEILVGSQAVSDNFTLKIK